MEYNRIDFKRGADPPRNESERVGTHSLVDLSTIDNSAGNGFSIAAADLNNIEVKPPQRWILHTRSLRSSAAVMLSALGGGDPLAEMTIGRAGQMSSIFLTGLFCVQRSCRSRRRGDPNTRLLHL